jgi:hypothetical protein
MMTPYKMAAGQYYHVVDELRYNVAHASVRVAVEHTIGMLKGGFPFLWNVPLIIDRDNHCIYVCVRYIEACMVLHNVLLAGNNYEEYNFDVCYDKDDVNNDDGDHVTQDAPGQVLVFEDNVRNNNEKRAFLKNNIKNITRQANEHETD